MAIYRIDNTIVNTDKATQSWSEDTWFDGNNYVSIPTGSQWSHERLHKSRKGRYYLESWSDYHGSRPRVEWMTPREAALWLRENAYPLPDDLASIENEIEE